MGVNDPSLRFFLILQEKFDVVKEPLYVCYPSNHFGLLAISALLVALRKIISRPGHSKFRTTQTPMAVSSVLCNTPIDTHKRYKLSILRRLQSCFGPNLAPFVKFVHENASWLSSHHLKLSNMINIAFDYSTLLISFAPYAVVKSAANRSLEKMTARSPFILRGGQKYP